VPWTEVLFDAEGAGRPACQPRIRLNSSSARVPELDPVWPNQVTIRSLDNFYGYEPGRYLADITPTSGSHWHRRPREIGSQHIFEGTTPTPRECRRPSYRSRPPCKSHGALVIRCRF
jgi:hypothetical protein